MASSTAHDSRGVAAAGTAFVIWGLVPVFWKALGLVEPFECLAHRFFWSALVAGGLVVGTGGWRTLFRYDRRAFAALALSGALIAVNWFVFIWAVQQGRILDTSLGYFINPLVSIALGAVLLREPIQGLRRGAVLLATTAVLYQSIALGRLPWISLLLAITFGLYGYVRKMVTVGPLDGLLIETLFMLPPAIGYLVWLYEHDGGRFLHDGLRTDLLLMATGPVTAVPLLLFAFGARRLQLSMVGFLQYIAPSLTFVLAVAVYGEPLAPARLVAFGLTWAALALVALEAWRAPAVPAHA